jgi:type II secretory pathway predicted ATPase ExeA
MYEIYQLHTEPFRLSPDPAFCYAHKRFSMGHAYMKYALTQGDGICIVTGHPGTGKTMLVEYFLRELDRSALLTATLLNTQVEEDDLFRMVGFGFGIDMRNLDRATMLHNLQEFLRAKRRSGHRALLIVDEAQELSATALEQLRMLTNLKDRSQSLLQLFLVGQKQLIDVVRRPEMEPLYQRLVSAADLEPLLIDETSAYIQHRLRCAGWPGGQLFSRQAVVLIHRFSAGYPRLINKICGRALLYGSMEQKPRLGAEDIFNTLGQVQDEHLMPGNDIRETGVATGLQDMLNTGFKDSDWTSHLTREEQAFLKQPDMSPKPMTSPETVSQHASAPVTAYAPEQFPSMPLDTPASPRHHETRPLSPAITANRDTAAEDAVSQNLAYKQVSGKPGLYDGWKNPWVGVAASAVLSLILFGVLTDRSANTGNGSTAAIQMAAYQDIEPAVGEPQPAQQMQEPVADDLRAMRSYEPEASAIQNPFLMAPAGETAALKPQGVLSGTQVSGRERDTGGQAMDSEVEAPVRVHPAPQTPQPETQVALVEQGPIDEAPTVKPGVTSQDSADVATAVAVKVALGNPAGITRSAPLETAAVEAQAPAAGNHVPETAEGSDAAAVTSVDGKVAALLASAEEAYQTDRLTIPSGRSAFSYFSQVLVLDPDNEVAQQGMQRIVARYRGMAQRALQREEFSRAQTLAARGLGIKPGDTSLLRLKEKARSLEIEAMAAQLRAAAPPPPKVVEVNDNDQIQEGFWGALKNFFTATPAGEVSTRHIGDDEP